MASTATMIFRITRVPFAEKIGVSRQAINAMGSNKYVPGTVLALKIAKLFGKKVEEIFELDPED